MAPELSEATSGPPACPLPGLRTKARAQQPHSSAELGGGVENVAQLAGHLVDGEGLLQEVGARIDDAVVDDGIAGLAGRKDDLHAGLQF